MCEEVPHRQLTAAAADPLEMQPQSKQFLYLYALAVAGGAVAYVPFLTILLPNHVSAFAEKGALTLLAQLAFVGAIAASIANILFGWASDRGGARRPLIVAGLIVTSALLPLIQFATTPLYLMLVIVCWQTGLNMMLAPLAAWAGDCVPDSQKGMLGGLLAFAPALGALAGALVTLPGVASDGERLVIIALLVIAMVAPVIILGRPVAMPHLSAEFDTSDKSAALPLTNRSVVFRMWVARLFIQIAEASLFAFLLLWFRSVAPDFSDNDAAIIFAAVLAAAVAATLVVGRWSDRARQPIRPLVIYTASAAIGLLTMALADSLVFAIAGYALFGISSGIFLALHSSQTLRILPRPATRGRDLGLFNLTNTIPSLIMPWLTLAMVPVFGFDGLFLLLAALVFIAFLLLATMSNTPIIS